MTSYLCCKCVLFGVLPLGSVFLIVSTQSHAKFPHGSEIWRNADPHQLRCPSIARIPPSLTQHHPCQFRQRWTMGNILFTLSYRQSYYSACEWPQDFVFLYTPDYFKPCASWEVYLIITEDFQASDVKYNGTHMNTHQILDFDMEITLTAQQRRVYPFTLSAQCGEGRWYTVDSWLPYGYACSHFLSDYDKGPSMKCALMTENECRISFHVVGGDTGIIAYNLEMYGKFYNGIQNR